MSSSQNSRLTLGVDIGGTKTLVGIVDRDGGVLDSVRAATPADAGAEAILDTVARLVAGLRATAPAAVLACGVGSAGTISDAGTVLSATDHLAGWTGTDLVSELEARLDLPAVAVNDVHAAALGESWAGYPSAADRSLLVAVGTGIGGALIVGGKLVRGANGAAGSIGHVRTVRSEARVCSCGGVDHLEAYASGPGMELTYRELTHTDRRVSLREIGVLADGGEREAASVLREAAELLGDSLADAACLVDPGVVFLAGGVLGLGARFIEPVQRRVADRLGTPPLNPEVRPATLGSDAALVGAGLLAQRLLDGAELDALFA